MDMFISNSFLIDGLINISNVDFTTTTTPSSSSTGSQRRHQPLLPPPQNPFHHHNNQSSSTTFPNDFFPPLPSADPTVDLCIPNDDVVEPEWLSQFVDYCFHDDFSATCETMVVGSSVPQSDDTTFIRKTDHHGKRSRAAGGKSRPKTEPDGGSSWSTAAPGEGSGVRRCTHCASEKTPQWRSGPLGPKTLCNACGVRYKSGRLVPEYRPASSPTFVLSQHSNSHRKVLELRRQKELVMMKHEAQ